MPTQAMFIGGGMKPTRQSFVPPQGNRTGFRHVALVVALMVAIALLTDVAFSPWQYDGRNAQASSLSMIPRIAAVR